MTRYQTGQYFAAAFGRPTPPRAKEDYKVSDTGRPPPNDLGERLAAARARQEARQSGGKSQGPTGLGTGMRIAVDLVAGIAVGVVIGLFLDRWLGTTPWLLVAFFVLGAAAGIRNVFRTASRFEEQARARAAEENGE